MARLMEGSQLTEKLFDDIASYMDIAKGEARLNDGNVKTLEVSFDRFTHQ